MGSHKPPLHASLLAQSAAVEQVFPHWPSTTPVHRRAPLHTPPEHVLPLPQSLSELHWQTPPEHLLPFLQLELLLHVRAVQLPGVGLMHVSAPSLQLVLGVQLWGVQTPATGALQVAP